MVNFQWSIFMVDLNPVIGSEQAGRRPVLVVSNEAFNQNLSILTAIPITSYKDGRKIYPAEVYLPKLISGLPRHSIALAHQIRTISKKRLISVCGEIRDDDLKEQIREALRVHLDLGIF